MTLRGMLVGLVAVGMPVAAMAEAVAVDAGALFKRSCAMCHGPDGKATTPAAKKMGVKDLSLTELTDEQIRGTIVQGVRGPKGAMPAFGTKFSDADLEALISHIRSLRPAENAAKPQG